MKKKLLLVVLASSLIVGATACGKNTTDSASENAQTQEQTKEENTEATEATEATGSDRADYVPVSELAVDDYVTLMDYSNLVVEAQKPEVTDDIIKKYINKNVLQKVPVTNRAAQSGDTVTIDFEGKKDGVAFEGGTATDFPLVLGSKSFIPGFEDGLIGVEPGKTVDLDLTFPEDYTSKELAGQAVVFTVTIKNILVDADFDTVSDEDLATMGLEDKTKEQIWEEAKKTMAEEAELSYESAIANAIIEQLMTNCTVTNIPDYLVEEEVKSYIEYLTMISQVYYGCDLETYLSSYEKITMDEFNEQASLMAQDTVKQYLIMEAISRKEGFPVTEEEILEKASQEAKEYGFETGEEVIEAIGQTTYRLPMLQERVLEFLKKNVTVK